MSIKIVKLHPPDVYRKLPGDSMTDDLLKILNSLFQTVADEPDVRLEPSTTADDVEDWDSLNHITFIVAIEKHFGIKFSNNEINGWKNVGEIEESIRSKI